MQKNQNKKTLALPLLALTLILTLSLTAKSQKQNYNLELTKERQKIEIQKEVERVRAGSINSEELQRCKARLKAQKRMSLQTPGSRAMQVCLDVLYELPLDNWKKYDARIDAVDIPALQNFAKKYLSDECRLKYVIGP